MRKPHETGVALLTVLLLVAVMAAVSTAILDDIRFGVRRVENARNVGQAQWYALGAEALAQARIRRLFEQDPDRTPDPAQWNGRPFEFPTDDGGMIRASISDGGACFNLNSVVEGRGELLMRRQLGIDQFEALLTALGVARARSLAESLADWIDSDSSREAQGGEDEAYASGAEPYRTGGTLLSEVSELRAVNGLNETTYRRIRPYVCALPTSDQSTLNLNTVPVDRPELITMLTSGAVQIEPARRVLASRPNGGWGQVADFWLSPTMSAVAPTDAMLDQTRLVTRFFTLTAEVDQTGSEVVMTALLERTPAGPVRLRARRWTFEE